MSIILIDDNKKFLETFKHMSEDHWNLKTFSDANAALKAISTDRPALVLSDVNMPVVHGLQFLNLVRIIRPNQNFAYVSGNPKGQVEQDFGPIEEGVQFFRKLDSEKIEDYIEESLMKATASDSDEVRDPEYVAEGLSRYRSVLKSFSDWLADHKLEDVSTLSDDQKFELAIHESNIKMCAVVLNLSEGEHNKLLAEWNIHSSLKERLIA